VPAIWRAGAIYGGVLIAQIMACAKETLPAGVECISIQAQYHNPGLEAEPYTIRIERTRNSRSFWSRRATMTQKDSLLVTAMVTFQQPVPADPAFMEISKQSVEMPKVPPPEGLPTLWELSKPILKDGFIPKQAVNGIFGRYQYWNIRPTNGAGLALLLFPSCLKRSCACAPGDHYLLTPVRDRSPRRQYWCWLNVLHAVVSLTLSFRMRMADGHEVAPGDLFAQQCTLAALPEGYYHVSQITSLLPMWF
jgi:hypothetical protein